MNQEVFFTNIRTEIIKNLQNCNSELKIAVAWFTDKKIIKEVNDLIKKGVEVEIIIYDDKINQKTLFKDLYYSKAKIYLSKKLMHNKFCIIDSKTIINGSYNWTLNASSNEENITITYNDYAFAKRFSSQFQMLSKTCKTIEDFFEYSVNSIEKIQETIPKFYQNKVKYSFPYFLDCLNPEITKINASANFRKGYYLIRNKEEEELLLWVIFLLKSEYSLNKLCNIIQKKIIYPPRYNYVGEIYFDKNNVGKFNENKHLVEQHFSSNFKSFYVFFINPKGDVVGDKIQYTKKFPNGIYLKNFTNTKTQIVDGNLTHFDFNISISQIHDKIGVIGTKKSKGFGNKYKYGVVDFIGKTIFDFKYDDFIILEDKKIIEFIEYPYIQFNLAKDTIHFPSWSKDDYINKIHKKTSYNFNKYSNTKASALLYNLPSGNQEYLFLSDENARYKSLYIAISEELLGTKFQFLTRSDITYSKLLEFKKEFSLGQSGLSFLTSQENKLIAWDEHLRINQLGNYKQKEGCYIATMVYGNYNHSTVLELRKFRDGTLKQNITGRKFIRFYYKYSPDYVNYVKNKKILNIFSKVIVKGIALVIKTWHNNV